MPRAQQDGCQARVVVKCRRAELRMKLIAQAGARRLALADYCRHKRPFRTLQTESSSQARVHASRLCVHSSAHGVAGITRLRAEARPGRCVAGAVEGCLANLAGLSVQTRKHDAESSLPFHMSILMSLDVRCDACVLAPKRGSCWLLAALSRPMAGHQFGGVPEAPDSLLERGPLTGDRCRLVINGWAGPVQARQDELAQLGLSFEAGKTGGGEARRTDSLTSVPFWQSR